MSGDSFIGIDPGDERTGIHCINFSEDGRKDNSFLITRNSMTLENYYNSIISILESITLDRSVFIQVENFTLLSNYKRGRECVTSEIIGLVFGIGLARNWNIRRSKGHGVNLKAQFYGLIDPSKKDKHLDDRLSALVYALDLVRQVKGKEFAPGVLEMS